MASRILDKWDALHARVHRWRWWTRLVVAAIVVPLFWQYARTRMNTPPADPNATAAWYGIGAPTPNCASLLAAIARIPPLPVLPAPPPAPTGKRWVPTKSAEHVTLPLPSINTDEALSGPWTPDTRYHLQAIVAYLETPALEAALDEVAREAGVARLPIGYFNGPAYSQFRGVGKLLCARARYNIAQRHDVAAAARDIRAMLDLCAMLEREGSLIRHLVAIAIRSFAYEELVNWSRQIALTRSQQQDLLAVLQSRPYDLKANWQGANRTESQRILAVGNAIYTRDTDGNGWFVPYPRQTDDLADKLRSTLNVLSPLVNDRRTVLGKMQFAIERADHAPDLPLRQALHLMGHDRERQTMANPADGPFGMVLGWSVTAHVYLQFIHAAVGESAAITSLGISVYHAERGRYPNQLSDLVPEYVPSLPIDPVTGQPLHYRLDDRDGYSLYSPGADGVDDGGQIRDSRGGVMAPFAGKDWTFSGLDEDAEEYSVDWYLVPDDTEQQSATSQPQ
jgi:hypothetical protein